MRPHRRRHTSVFETRFAATGLRVCPAVNRAVAGAQPGRRIFRFLRVLDPHGGCRRGPKLKALFLLGGFGSPRVRASIDRTTMFV